MAIRWNAHCDTAKPDVLVQVPWVGRVMYGFWGASEAARGVLPCRDASEITQQGEHDIQTPPIDGGPRKQGALAIIFCAMPAALEFFLVTLVQLIRTTSHPVLDAGAGVANAQVFSSEVLACR